MIGERAYISPYMRTRSKKSEEDAVATQASSETINAMTKEMSGNSSNPDTAREAERNPCEQTGSLVEKTYVFRGDRTCMALLASDRERQQVKAMHSLKRTCSNGGNLFSGQESEMKEENPSVVREGDPFNANDNTITSTATGTPANKETLIEGKTEGTNVCAATATAAASAASASTVITTTTDTENHIAAVSIGKKQREESALGSGCQERKAPVGEETTKKTDECNRFQAEDNSITQSDGVAVLDISAVSPLGRTDGKGSAGGEPVASSTPVKRRLKHHNYPRLVITRRSPYRFNECQGGSKKSLISNEMKACASSVLCGSSNCSYYTDVRTADRYIKCSKCNRLSYDYRPVYTDPIDFTPHVTPLQKECFGSVKSLWDDVTKNLREEGGISMNSVRLMGKLRHKAIEGTLLMQEGNLQPWTEHRPLQEAIEHCTRALEQMDIKEFRNSFYSMLYHMKVSYPLRHRVPHKDMRVNEASEELEQSYSKYVGTGTSHKDSPGGSGVSNTINCGFPDCLEKYVDRQPETYIECKKCKGIFRDYSTSCSTPPPGQTTASQQEQQSFREITVHLATMVKHMLNDGGISQQIIWMMEDMKVAAIKGGLLLPDGAVQPWHDHKPLHDAIMQMEVALALEDKATLRKGLYCTYFHMIEWTPKLIVPEQKAVKKNPK